MATRPLSSINEGEHNGWEKLTGKQGKTDTKSSCPQGPVLIPRRSRISEALILIWSVEHLLFMIILVFKSYVKMYQTIEFVLLRRKSFHKTPFDSP